MKKQLFLFLFLVITCFSIQAQSDANNRLYELRTYYASEGKMQDLMNRFQQHTLKFFYTYNMRLEGFWLPLGENKENKLVYLLSYPSREARDKSWKEFMKDKDWVAVMKNSAINGEIVAKVESIFLKTTDFSPNDMKSVGDRVFELRTYKTKPNLLPNLLERFRNHTLKIFEKFGMTNIIYWTPTDKEQGSEDLLVYFLTHKSKESGLASFKAFGESPEWQAVKKASEEKAGTGLTISVKSEYFAPADFSPLK
ncbi:NIPSNAP family protein [Arcicella sp. LKC2W]|uniref:NIPSNAP family protein n=1 Tax=Arcicella sp. LKC2W TaxID=2984198 RepID=UPI002B1FC5D6|nr:NIPSNAP family protein [Arcicella sp. LKC2W]MEA5458098.1 NIPSNAP family protein [Arcicella sp. LKC2W]